MWTWPIINAKRACKYFSYADTLENGNNDYVVKCKCCHREFPEMTREDLQLDWWGKECVHCRSYICGDCYETGLKDIPGTCARDFNKSEHRAYISFAWCYMQCVTAEGYDDIWWGDWISCSKSCRARHHWFRAACKVNIMTMVYLNSDPYRTYKRNLQKARLFVSLLSKDTTQHAVWNLLFQNFDTLLEIYFTKPKRPALPGLPRLDVPEF